MRLSTPPMNIVARPPGRTLQRSINKSRPHSEHAASKSCLLVTSSYHQVRRSYTNNTRKFSLNIKRAISPPIHVEILQLGGAKARFPSDVTGGTSAGGDQTTTINTSAQTRHQRSPPKEPMKHAAGRNARRIEQKVCRSARQALYSEDVTGARYSCHTLPAPLPVSPMMMYLKRYL